MPYFKFKIDSSAFLCHSVCRAKCQPILGNNVIIFVEDSSSISVFNVETNYRNKILFTGHKKSILAMALSPVDQKFLCTCSRDCIMVWDFEALQSEGITACRKFTILNENGFVGQCCFSWDSNWLALSKENEICVFKIKDSVTYAFKPHYYTFIETVSSQGNCCTFSQENPKLFVTAEGTCLKVWDISSVKLLSQCSIPGLSNVTCCNFAPKSMRLLLGTSGGTVLVYAVNGKDHPYPIMSVNVGKDFAKYFNTKMTDQPEFSARMDIGCIVFSVNYFGLPERNSSSFEDTEESIHHFSRKTYMMITKSSGQLLVCSNLGLALYNCNSWQCLCLLPISDIFASKMVDQHFLVHFLTIGGTSTDKLICASKIVVKDSMLALASLHVAKGDCESNGINEATYKLEKRTMVASYPMLSKSPLSKSYCSNTSMRCNGNVSAYTLPCKKVSMDRVVSVKSSGYGKTPPAAMFRPFLGIRAMKKTPDNGKGSKLAKFELPGFKDNMLLLGPPTKKHQTLDVGDSMGTRLLASSANGNNLACSSGSKYIHVTSFSNMKENDPILVGHDASINSMHFSLSSKWLVSSSEDMTVRMWNLKSRKCVKIINSVTRASSPRLSPRMNRFVSPTNKTICQRISRAQFYYMDQFVLLSSGGQLELYDHSLGYKEPQEDNTGPPKRSSPRMVCKVNVPTHMVTCFNAINSFYSFQVICGCLNKTIHAYDMNVEKVSLKLEDVHGRPPHCIRQLEGSSRVAHCANMHDLFLSTSVCDHVKLWDFRNARCVLRFSQHSSRTYKNGIDISPCGRFVAVSADDKSVYIYDARKCDNYIGKLPMFSEVVTDVVFHRQKPLLAAVTLDGNLYTYSAVCKDQLL